MARLPTLSVLLSMKAIFDAIEQNSYPEKAAEQLSQGRTGADPTRPAFTLQSLETGAMAGQPSLRADYRVLTSILFCCCIASGVFGSVTDSTPFLKFASILSRSTPAGSENARRKEPKRRSEK